VEEGGREEERGEDEERREEEGAREKNRERKKLKTILKRRGKRKRGKDYFRRSSPSSVQSLFALTTYKQHDDDALCCSC